jgi:hypothetical protein
VFTVGSSLPGRLPDNALEFDNFEDALVILEDNFIMDWDENIEYLVSYTEDIGPADANWMDGLDELRRIAKITQDFDYLFNGVVYFIREYNE